MIRLSKLVTVMVVFKPQYIYIARQGETIEELVAREGTRDMDIWNIVPVSEPDVLVFTEPEAYPNGKFQVTLRVQL